MYGKVARPVLCARHAKIWNSRSIGRSAPRAVVSGVGANRRSLPLAVLTRRLNPDAGVPNIIDRPANASMGLRARVVYSRQSPDWTPDLIKPQTGRFNKSRHTVQIFANRHKEREIILITAERHKRIDLRRPPRRDVTSEQRHQRQQRGDAHKRQRIGCAHAEQQRLHQAC